MYNNPIENLRPEEILIYLRKSRADDPTLSIEQILSNHEAKLREWEDRNLSYPIPEENRFRDLVSGESVSDRPSFQKVLKLIEQPNYKAVLVVDISRLGRPDTMEIGLISKIFRFTSTIVITPDRTFNVADDYERGMFEEELKRGAYYLEFTKKKLKDGRERSVKNGNCILSRGLYGYDKITIIEDRRKCPTLAINEEQANVVRMIFDWYVNENVGTSNIANRLNELQIKSPRGNLWSADSIRTILENRHYIGMVKLNERKAVLVVENGEFRKTRPKNIGNDFILAKGKHEPIISEELFNAAQEKRGRTHKTCNNKELRNPLASLLYCECGRAMSYRHSTRGNLNYREPRLVCNAQQHCGNGSCSVSEIVDFVVNILKQRIAEFQIEAERGTDDSNKYHEKLIKSLEKKLTDLDARELSLWESQVDPDPENRMPPHIFQALTAKLAKEREEFKTSLETARKAITKPKDYAKMVVTFQKALDALLDEEVSVAEKNKLLKACITRITYHRDAHQRVQGKGTGRQCTSPPIYLDVKLKV